MQNRTLKVINNDGIEFKYEVLMSFEMIATGKRYIVYTDHSLDNDGDTNVFASVYDPSSSAKLTPIQTEEEWDYIEKMLNSAQQDYCRNH